MNKTGPLAGIRIVEMAGIGPTPMTAMLLADLGATVVRIDRLEPAADLGIQKPAHLDLTNRGRQSIAVDLKKPEGIALVLDLVAKADGLIEGFRPGTMERLGLGPEVCLARNPKLVYGRMTGWGQTGPLASRAGHDINYIALTGALDLVGRADGPPTPPLNLVGDFGGGSMYLAVGMLSAMLEARTSGQGQVVDAAMVEGAASLMTFFYGLAAAGLHNQPRGHNLLDSGAPQYDTYRCADGRYLAVGAIELKFRAEFYKRVGIDPKTLPDATNKDNWPKLKQIIAERLLTRTRDEWTALLQDSDACCAPVLSLEEAPQHPHNRARGSFVEIGGVVQPGPAPRFSRTQPGLPTVPEAPGQSTDQALREWGLAAAEIERLHQASVIGQAAS
ncbi:MAG: CaiB/BaiF CoA transferase family protein [Panacagrimonas sp.]